MTILVLSSHTPSLFWFRMDMMCDFNNIGAKVIAVGPESETAWKDKFAIAKIDYRSIPVSRNGMNVLADMKTFFALKRLIHEVKPDKIFTYQAKTIVYGALAAKCECNAEVYPMVAGLGSIFRGNGFKCRIVRTILSIQYKVAFLCSQKIIFQNTDDRDFLVSNKILPVEKTCIVHGSGVNLERFKESPLTTQKAVLYIGRLIADKGVREYLELCKCLHEKYDDVRCLLVGPFDTNPSAITPEELHPFIENGIIEYFGEQNDVRPYLEQCLVYVLPSYHEGTPKTVLEAMAIGRPVVTTDAPGCRETVDNGKNGFLVPVKDVEALKSAVIRLLDNISLAKDFAKESRRIAEEKYDIKKVNSSILTIMGL